jgi:hypothetical protein
MNYYLYVKTHNQTGLKYLGQTSKNPDKYQGAANKGRKRPDLVLRNKSEAQRKAASIANKGRKRPDLTERNRARRSHG